MLHVHYSLQMSIIDDELWMANDWKSINDSEVKLNFTMSNMLQYFINREAVDGKPANDFKNINTKVYPLFRAGHIQCVTYKEHGEMVLIKCKCYAEMKKYIV